MASLLVVSVVMLLLCSILLFFFFFNDTATTEIYTLSLHDALPISPPLQDVWRRPRRPRPRAPTSGSGAGGRAPLRAGRPPPPRRVPALPRDARSALRPDRGDDHARAAGPRAGVGRRGRRGGAPRAVRRDRRDARATSRPARHQHRSGDGGLCDRGGRRYG